MILDTAQQKGTGKWMSQHALDLGVPTTLITEAVYARCLSAQKEARVRASKVLTGPDAKFDGRQASSSSKTSGRRCTPRSSCSYAQGYVQLDAAADEFGWKLNNGNIALLWRGGCIIRSRVPGRHQGRLRQEPRPRKPAARRLLQVGHRQGPAELAARRRHGRRTRPARSRSSAAALTYYDGYRRARLPANLLQAQRDYFGAHTYERIDKPRGERSIRTGFGNETVNGVGGRSCETMNRAGKV